MIPVGKPPAWTEQALCAQIGDPDLWFPEKGGSNADAKRVCAACPVRVECAQMAIDNGEKFGVWGGTSGFDRRDDTPPEPSPCAHCGETPGYRRRSPYCSDRCRRGAHQARRQAREAA